MGIESADTSDEEGLRVADDVVANPVKAEVRSAKHSSSAVHWTLLSLGR